MPGTDGSLVRHAALAACLALFPATPAAAQQQPVIAPAPERPEFLSRFDFHMSIDRLMRSQTPEQAAIDQRFSWDSHFGGSFDLVDYVAGRLVVRVDYQTVMGREYRPFDPNQGNYVLEASLSRRLGRTTEAALIFHHVSRHLSDRPKEFAVAWNELGARVLHRVARGETTLDVDIEGGRAIQHSYVDYTWLAELNLLLRRSLGPHAGLFAHGGGRVFLVNEAVRRGTQAGGRFEVGVSVNARGAVMEIFAGYEKRVDADPLDRLPQRWGLAGLRLLSR